MVSLQASPTSAYGTAPRDLLPARSGHYTPVDFDSNGGISVIKSILTVGPVAGFPISFTSNRTL